MITSIILTLLIAMVPVIELRGAIPFGVARGLAPLLSAGVAIIGNLLPIPFLLLLVPKIFDFLRDKKYTKKMILRQFLRLIEIYFTYYSVYLK